MNGPIFFWAFLVGPDIQIGASLCSVLESSLNVTLFPLGLDIEADGSPIQSKNYERSPSKLLLSQEE